MAYFYSATNNNFLSEDYIEDYKASNSWPDDAKEVTNEVFQEFALDAPPEGKERTANSEGLPSWTDKVLSASYTAQNERSWRDVELDKADIALFKIQDGETSTSNEAAWRQYRKDLRAWPQSKDFPKVEKRPVSPK